MKCDRNEDLKQTGTLEVIILKLCAIEIYVVIIFTYN